MCRRTPFIGIWLIKKAWESYLILVPLVEALELPISVERANLQSLTQNVLNATAQHSRAVWWQNIHFHISHLLFATYLTEIEVFQVSTSQEGASSKRFSKCCSYPPTSSRTGSRPGGLQLQNYNYFFIKQRNTQKNAKTSTKQPRQAIPAKQHHKATPQSNPGHET